MKSILISIQPKWVAKILNGEKTIEVRKSKPNVDLPIDVYIYCTKDKKDYLYSFIRDCTHTEYFVINNKNIKNAKILNGKVVAKFTLNKVEWTARKHLPFACINEQEYRNYVKDGIGYAWHIDDLEIFDKPKELSEIKHCTEKTCIYGRCHKYMHCLKSLTKAPQSWCYVEVE